MANGMGGDKKVARAFITGFYYRFGDFLLTVYSLIIMYFTKNLFKETLQIPYYIRERKCAFFMSVQPSIPLSSHITYGITRDQRWNSETRFYRWSCD
jgi:hypothetical protein